MVQASAPEPGCGGKNDRRRDASSRFTSFFKLISPPYSSRRFTFVYTHSEPSLCGSSIGHNLAACPTQPSQLTVERTRSPRERKDKSTLVFGQSFTDHMLHLDWDMEKGGWSTPRILPFGDLAISPAASSLHYGLQVLIGTALLNNI